MPRGCPDPAIKLVHLYDVYNLPGLGQWVGRRGSCGILRVGGVLHGGCLPTSWQDYWALGDCVLALQSTTASGGCKGKTIAGK